MRHRVLASGVLQLFNMHSVLDAAHDAGSISSFASKLLAEQCKQLSKASAFSANAASNNFATAECKAQRSVTRLLVPHSKHFVCETHWYVYLLVTTLLLVHDC
jgi:hypothetical protein